MVGGKRILNEQWTWSDFKNEQGVRLAFLSPPVKVQIPANRMLCRFITNDSKKPGVRPTQIFAGKWWIEWSTAAAMFSRFGKMGATPRDIIRARLGLTVDFSEVLDGMAQIILTQPVYAWKGIARYQNDASRKVTYMGGGEQFFLPGLANGIAANGNGIQAGAERSNYARLHSFSWVDSLG